MPTLIIQKELNASNMNDYDLPEPFIKEIYLLVKAFNEFCDKHNLIYWIDGGTLLGCIREQNQIRYDNDADVGMLQGDFDKFVSLKSELEQEPYNFMIKEETTGFMKIFSRNVAIEVDDDKIISPCLDVVLYKRLKDLIIISNDEVRKMFPKHYHMDYDLNPLIRVKYSDLGLRCPNNPFPYLDRCYLDWRDKRIYDHKIYDVSDEDIERFTANNSKQDQYKP